MLHVILYLSYLSSKSQEGTETMLAYLQIAYVGYIYSRFRYDFESDELECNISLDPWL